MSQHEISEHSSQTVPVDHVPEPAEHAEANAVVENSVEAIEEQKQTELSTVGFDAR